MADIEILEEQDMDQKIQYTESLEDNISLMNHFHLAITWTRLEKEVSNTKNYQIQMVWVGRV